MEYLLFGLLSHVWLSYDPMDCSQPGSSAHGISQARILEWAAISFSGGPSQPRSQTTISTVGIREAHNGILLSHWKEWSWVSWSDVDEPRACHTEWSKKKQILYVKCIYIESRKMALVNLIADRSWGADVENRLMEMGGKQRWEWIERVALTYTWPCVKQTPGGKLLYSIAPGGQLGALWWPRRVGWGWWWEGGSWGRGYMYTYGWFTVLYSRNQYNIVKTLLQ